MRAFVNSLVAAVLLFLSSLPAGAVRINLASDGVEQYFYILELYILPALVVITFVLLCGYIVGKIFNRRSKNDGAAKQPSAEMEKEEGTAAFLKELRSTPPIRDTDPGGPTVMDEAGAAAIRDDSAENTTLDHEDSAQFRLAAVEHEKSEPTVTTEASPEPTQAPPITSELHADKNSEPRMTTESTATAAALLARISRKKSASARRLSEVLDAPLEDTSPSAALDPADGAPGANQDNDRGFGALLADAKSEALDRVPEALLLGELPKEGSSGEPNLGDAAALDQGASPENGGSPHAVSEHRRNNAPNFSLLAMVPDAGAETPQGAEGPAQNTSRGTAYEDVLDLTLDAASEGFPEDEVLDLTHETSHRTPADEALDLTDAVDADMPFEGALELHDETISNEPGIADLEVLPEAGSDNTLELTQEITPAEPVETAPESPLVSGDENRFDELQSNSGLDLPHDLTPFMPSQSVEGDIPTAEAGYGGASDSVTFTLPEDLSDPVPPNASLEPASGMPVDAQSETVGDRSATADGIQNGADQDTAKGTIDASLDVTRNLAAVTDEGVAGLLNPFNTGVEGDTAAAPLDLETDGQTMQAADVPADQSAEPPVVRAASQPEEPSDATTHESLVETHESLVERILRRQTASKAVMENATREPAGRDDAPRESLWATEPPAAPLPASDAALGDPSAGTPEPHTADGAADDGRSADEAVESAPSPTDAFSDPLFLNELLGDGKFSDEPAPAAETAIPDTPPEITNLDGEDTVSASEPAPVAPLPLADQPASSEEWVVAAEDILDVEPEPAPAVSIEPVEPVEPILPGESVVASDEPDADTTGPSALVVEQPAQVPTVGEDSPLPDAALDQSSAETPPITPSIVEGPMIWHEGAAATNERRTERDDSVVEPWATQPAVQPHGVEVAQEAAQRFSGEFLAAATALQRLMASLDENIKAEKGLSLDDIGAMRVPSVDGLDDTADRLAVFGADLGREIEDGAATVSKFNHVVGRLTEMAAAQDLDEGWNEIIRQRISEALYTVEKVQAKIAAMMPPENTAAEKPEDANAPSATG
ncbi:MAG: hypothetical protein OEU46_13900 [Alphaproteobacteria bacterium]|nr:hypothetical protein [Alphaproteobacteria bacterium]